MKLPRDVSGDELIRLLRSRLKYKVIRQTGSHVRLALAEENKTTIPRHRILKVGTLNSIINEVAEQSGITKEELIRNLWG